MYPDIRAAHMAKSHRLSEVQPPPSLEAAEKGIALLDRGHDVGVTRVDQGPGAIPSGPAVPVRKLLAERGSRRPRSAAAPCRQASARSCCRTRSNEPSPAAIWTTSLTPPARTR